MSSIKTLYHYFRATILALRLRPNVKTLWYAFRYCYSCLKYYNNPKHNSILDAKPWMAFPAIDALDKFLTKDSRVFEYGSGGSTLFFAKRAKEVVSVEHHREWYNLVKEELRKRNIKNIDYKLIEPIMSGEYDRLRIADPDAYVSDDDNSAGMTYEAYAKSIMQYPDNYFDLVVVDGRVRPSCMFHALNKVKKGGILLLDNSERIHYLRIMQKYLQGWEKVSYMSSVPYNIHFSETTLFFRA